jgi:hypothetical protein
MAQNWRLAVCTKRRAPISILIAIISYVSLLAIASLIEEYHLRRLEHGRNLLKVGMTEKELIDIMGQPAIRHLKTVAELTPRGFPGRPLPDEIREHHTRLVEYFFSGKRILWSRSAFVQGGVFLDEDRKAIVYLDYPVRGILEFKIRTRERWIWIFCLVAAVMMPVVGFWLWCSKKLRDNSVQKSSTNSGLHGS